MGTPRPLKGKISRDVRFQLFLSREEKELLEKLISFHTSKNHGIAIGGSTLVRILIHEEAERQGIK